MVDEAGLEAQKRIEKPSATKPQKPPKEATPLGASEQKIINRIDQDGDEDKVLRDIAGDETSQTLSINKDRVTAKTEGAFAIVSRYGSASRDSIESEITQRVNHLTRIINSEGGSGYDLEGIVGETRIDQNGNLTAPKTTKPETILRLVTEYAASEAAISSLYTSSPDVQSLPPEAYRLELTDLTRKIDDNGIFLQHVGSNRQGIRTRFYSIPGKQLDADKKLIPPDRQKVLVIQDTPVRDEGYLRTYTVNTTQEIGDYLQDFIQAQTKEGTNGVSEQRTAKETGSNNDLLEEIKNADNPFDDEAASKVIGITREWVKYGGNLYDHLTGKDPRLARGVDYKALSDGRPDMESYRVARHQRVEAWLQQHGNQKWLVDGEQFSRDHSGEIGGMETVQARQSDGTLANKQRYTTPYFYNNGWLYYESNYFDKQTGQMTQPNRESTKYRVYFSPDGEGVIGTFQDIITQLNADPEVQKQGFQIKTADVNKMSELEVGAIMNQRDRVVLYLGEEGMKAALPVLQKYAEASPQRFSQEGVLLGQPMVDSQGREIYGVVVTSEPRGRSPDPAAQGEYKSFSDVQSRIIESAYRSIVTGLKDPQNVAQLQAKYPGIYQRLASLGDKAGTLDYVRAIISDPNGEDFLRRNLQVVYPQWAKAYGMSTQNVAFKAA